ncbi:metal-dependent hydrolase [Salinarchaeum laminariae]|uniref:metal-dependent hydrolase n=1 Tax=Salinarchaeum laminariae TaxID=869888 RepID=UPI0020BD7CA6|nr:metal-dependent hydrolase [Salinarchaeum laminariae]
MLPWEHAAVGYLAYSLYARVVHRQPPRGDAVLAVAFAALLPDLIDKPLAWGAGALPSGKSLAHSLLFAGPAIVLAGLAAGRRIAVAFALSYLLHLGGDVLFPVALGHAPAYRFLFYPLIELPAADTPGLFARAGEVIHTFYEFLQTSRGRIYVLFEGALLGTTVVLWLFDGRPGLATIRRWLLPERADPFST